jgi:hypothetical protein
MGINKPSQDLPVERVQNSYRQLSLAAADLNTVTDELGKAISIWDAALKKLNLGVCAWVELSSGGEGFSWWDKSIGYTKIKDRWGISLREREGVDPPLKTTWSKSGPLTKPHLGCASKGLGSFPISLMNC